MGNTVNNLRYEIKSENCVKDKNNFFINQNIAFLFKQKHVLYMETYFFKIPKKLLTSAFFFFLFFIFFAEADTKRHRYASAKASEFADRRGEFQLLHW